MLNALNKTVTGTFALLVPASNASTVTGSAVQIDTLDLDGCIEFTQVTGSVTGSITGKIQDSANGTTGWADVTGGAFTADSSGNTVQRIIVPCGSCKAYLRYVGTIVTGPAFVSVTGSGFPKTS